MGVDFAATRYYGPPMTVDPQEMKDQFGKINELLEREANKYDLAKALHRSGPVKHTTFLAESANQKLDPGTILVPRGTAPQPRFTPQTVEELVGHYAYPAGSSGVGLVFVVEDLVKSQEQEIFWASFVDLSTGKMLCTEKLAGTGFGFHNHWASPLNAGIKTMKFLYSKWKKEFAAA